MRPSIFRSSRIMLTATALLLLTTTPAVLAQMPGSAPMGGAPTTTGTQPNGMQPNGMQPNGMQPMGPTASQNNRQLAVETQTFGNIRRNIDVENKLSKMALKKSSNADVKNFAKQVIADNRKLEGQVLLPASSEGMTFMPEVPKQTRQAEKQMKKLSGTQFDQLYLIQMDAYVNNDQQVARKAAQTTSVPKVSNVGSQLQTVTQQHQQQIAQLTKEEHIRIQ
jgi:predicted outer membrane protein